MRSRIPLVIHLLVFCSSLHPWQHFLGYFQQCFFNGSPIGFPTFSNTSNLFLMLIADLSSIMGSFCILHIMGSFCILRWLDNGLCSKCRYFQFASKCLHFMLFTCLSFCIHSYCDCSFKLAFLRFHCFNFLA